MKAVSMIRPGEMRILDAPEPRPGPEDVLIEVKCVGLCGSDLNAWRGLSPMASYPRVPGHEVAGTIVDRGPAAPERPKVGARVTLEPYTNCGRCAACRAKRPNCCQFNQTLGVQRDGALAERIAVHWSRVFASDCLSFEELALVEPLSVGCHAVNRGRIVKGETVAVFGCGAIGLGAVACAAHEVAAVLAVDIDEGKLAMAAKLGARHVVNASKQDVASRVRQLTIDEGPSVVIEAVGLPATYRLAVEIAAFAGRVVYIGYAKDEVAYDTKLFVLKELDILGSRNALGVFPQVLQMLEARQAPFQELITRVYKFEETEKALRDWAAAPREFTKILIDVKE